MMSKFVDLLEKEGSSPLFKPLEIGNKAISIQASFSHYCKPRETLKEHEWHCYDEWEIAIFSEKEWLHPSDDYFDNFDRQKDLCGRYENGKHPIGAYVPTGLIEDLILYIKETEGVDDYE